MPILCALLVTLAAQTWTPIASWDGSGTKETESFDVTAREWRLSWTATPTSASGRKTFSVTVMKDDLPVSVVTAGPTETAGESFVRGTGRYYLKISSFDAKWTLKAEQPQK